MPTLNCPGVKLPRESHQSISRFDSVHDRTELCGLELVDKLHPNTISVGDQLLGPSLTNATQIVDAPDGSV
jgi:hypothetical protein